MDVIEAFGPKLIALMALVAVGWFLITLAPVIWPAYRARKAALDRPWLFTVVVAALIYGALNFVLLVVAIPVVAYRSLSRPSWKRWASPMAGSL